MQELFLHGTITTSKSKAAAIKGTVDKIITLAKNKNTQRLIQSFFSDKLLQERIVNEIAPKLTSRSSGFTSVMRMGVRQGDRTTLVKMSLIGLEQLKPLEKATKSPRVKESKEIKSVVKKVLKPVAKKTAPIKTAAKRRVVKK